MDVHQNLAYVKRYQEPHVSLRIPHKSYKRLHVYVKLINYFRWLVAVIFNFIWDRNNFIACIIIWINKYDSSYCVMTSGQWPKTNVKLNGQIIF